MARRLCQAIARWLVSRHTLHQHYARLERELRVTLERNYALEQRLAAKKLTDFDKWERELH